MDNQKRTIQFEQSEKSRNHARDLIPAGCHTYSKGEDQFPSNAPRFVSKAEGCYAFDLDGNRFLDWAMGLRTVILGHCYPAVLDAVKVELCKGSNFSLPSILESDLAEVFVDLIPSAEMVKFAKNGSDVTTAATRLARAYTGRDYIALCSNGSFFSQDDWYIGATPCNSGIPKAIQDLTLSFQYNDINSLESLFDRYPDKIAAVILEATTGVPPEKGYLEKIRELTKRHGTLFILDEMITGFRWHLRGAQSYFGVTPDLSTFGKAIGNGFAISALVGRRDIMELGGLTHKKDKVFLLSSTHGGETHALAASLATIKEIREKDVIGHIWKIGEKLKNGFNEISKQMSLNEYVRMEGYPCSPVVVCCDREGKTSLPFRTLFLQEMMAQEILIPYITVSFSHTEREVEITLNAVQNALKKYQWALENNGIERVLKGPVVKPVFRRKN